MQEIFSKIPQDNSVGVNFFAQTLNSLEIYWACPPPRLKIDFFKNIIQFPNIILIIFVPMRKFSNYWSYIVKGDFFHPILEKYKICDPVFEPNNVASNLFRGRKKFQSLALLARPGVHNRVKCIFWKNNSFKCWNLRDMKLWLLQMDISLVNDEMGTVVQDYRSEYVPCEKLFLEEIDTTGTNY